MLRDLKGVEEVREGFALVEGREAQRRVGGVHYLRFPISLGDGEYAVFGLSLRRIASQ